VRPLKDGLANLLDQLKPGGLLAATSEPASAAGYNDQLKDIALKYIGPYGIPLRSLLCRDVPNLALAGRNRRMLAVDHTFLFSGAVRCLRELVATNQLGRILYVESTRVNLGLYQPDCDVVWDLAPHDLAILAHVLGRPVPAVRSATASDLVVPGRPDLAHVGLDYGGIAAHLTLSWLSPVKIRRMVIAGDRRMAIWDDLDNVAKVQVYDCGAEAIPAGEAGRAARVEYRRGDMHAPKLDGREALAAEVDDLVGALDHWDDGCRRPPVSDGQLGLAVVRTLEEVSAAIEARR
jgi:predicted dehydrogenase